MFSQAESAAISDKYVAARLLGGNDLNDEGKAFSARYDVQGYPTLLVMTGEGDVLARDLPRDVSGILGALGKADTDNKAFLAKRDVLAKKADAASLTELADLYMKRENYDSAKGLYEQIAKKTPTAEVQGKLADILQKIGDTAGEKKVLEAMVAKFKGDAKSIVWRIRLATIDIPTAAKSREEWMGIIEKQVTALTALLEAVSKEGKPEAEAAVRVELGTGLLQKGDRDGMKAHMDWVLEKAPKCPVAATAHMRLAVGAFQTQDYKTALTHLEAIVKDFPDSTEAAEAGDAIPNVKERAKAQEEKEKEGGDEPK